MLVLVVVCAGAGRVPAEAPAAGAIDRKALVDRHRVALTRPDPLTPLTLGNGRFCFTADITGLQSFPDFHQAGMELGTLAEWAWHSRPNPERYSLEEVWVDYAASGGRTVPYADLDPPAGHPDPERRKRAAAWLRANPHRLHLGRIGLRVCAADGREAALEDLGDTAQTLNLWTGLLHSRFTFDGMPVEVRTVVHPQRDLVAVRIDSPAIAAGRLELDLRFPYGSENWSRSADWAAPERHRTVFVAGAQGGRFERVLDATRYTVRVRGPEGGRIRADRLHAYTLQPPRVGSVEYAVEFLSGSDSGAEGLCFSEVEVASARHWAGFWKSGAAVDLSGTRDPRGRELERRIVLSQYLTAVQCSGSMPPQETGLVQNSWHGKAHLEMHWWHAAHFALWGRPDLLERSLDWYRRILPAARETARSKT